MSPTTTEPAQNSPLLKLPAELRNYIYELVIESVPRIASSRTANEHLAMHEVRFTAEYGTCEPALPSVCRKIRREAKGMFMRRACKVVLHAFGDDEAEMIHWEAHLLRLFSQPKTMTSALAVEEDSPNLAAWECAIRFLWNAQVELSNDSAGADQDFFEGEAEYTTIYCAVDEVARNPDRKPWDALEDASSFNYLNGLLNMMEPSPKNDDWRRS